MVKIHADFLGGAEKNPSAIKNSSKAFCIQSEICLQELTPVVFFSVFSEVRFGI